jgi:hypothetical protein
MRMVMHRSEVAFHAEKKHSFATDIDDRGAARGDS